MRLLQTLEETAARGAEGLTRAARQAVAAALQALQRPDGGFAALDGRSDPYYTLFAWLGLRALGAAYDRDRLCAYMSARRHDANTVDAQCASLVLACEGRHPPAGNGYTAFVKTALRFAAALLRDGTHGVYSAFLLALAMDDVPRWLARLAWRRLFASGATQHLPTPRLAAGLLLATLAGTDEAGLHAALASRRRAGGGFASAAGAPADLLATAVARFARGTRNAALCGEREADLAFIEACWQEDGLFGPSPSATRGDAEHTFYGLLALGTCRR